MDSQRLLECAMDVGEALLRSGADPVADALRQVPGAGRVGRGAEDQELVAADTHGEAVRRDRVCDRVGNALRSRSLFKNSAVFSLKTARFWASDSSLARKKSAGFSRMNSEMRVVLPTLRRPYSTTRALPGRSYSACRV